MIIQEAQSIAIVNLSDITISLPGSLRWPENLDLYKIENNDELIFDCYQRVDDNNILIPSDCIDFDLEESIEIKGLEIENVITEINSFIEFEIMFDNQVVIKEQNKK